MFIKNFCFRSFFSRYRKLQFCSAKYDFLKFIPFNLEGIHLPPKSEEEVDHSTLNYFFSDNVIDGYQMAFQNYLEALAEGDLDFLQNVLEPKFYYRMKNYNEHLNQNNSSLIKMNEDEKFIVTIKKLKLNVGVEKNLLNLINDLQCENIFFKNNWDVKNFRNRSGKISKSLVIQVHAFLTSPKKLSLKTTGETTKNIDDASENIQSHKVIFECEGDMNYFRMFGQFFSFLTKNRFDTQKIFFHKKKYEWTIADVDDFMDENPFADENESISDKLDN
jgi:hypothetical protein